MRIVRWTLGIVGALVLLLAVALITLTRVVNPDRYRGEIERQVSRATGRPFLIEGHLHLSWFPWLVARVGPARLGAAPGQPGPDLLDWRSARLSVRLLPLLLHRRVQLGPIRLRGADIHLRRDPDGRGNWQGLLDRAHSRAAAPARLTVGGLDITDGTLHYVDRAGKPFILTHWRLRVSAWQPGAPLTVDTRFVLHGAKLPAAGVPVRLQLRRLRIQPAPLDISAPVVLLDVANASLRGRAALGRDARGLDGAGSLALAVPSVRGLLGLLGIRMRLPRDPAVLGKLSLRARWHLHDAVLAVNPLSARLDATTLSGWVDRSGDPQPLWRFALKADRIDLARYLPPTRKPFKPLVLPIKALRALHARGTLTVARATLKGTTARDIRVQVQ